MFATIKIVTNGGIPRIISTEEATPEEISRYKQLEEDGALLAKILSLANKTQTPEPTPVSKPIRVVSLDHILDGFRKLANVYDIYLSREFQEDLQIYLGITETRQYMWFHVEEKGIRLVPAACPQKEKRADKTIISRKLYRVHQVLLQAGRPLNCAFSEIRDATIFIPFLN